MLRFYFGIFIWPLPGAKRMRCIFSWGIKSSNGSICIWISIGHFCANIYNHKSISTNNALSQPIIWDFPSSLHQAAKITEWRMEWRFLHSHLSAALTRCGQCILMHIISEKLNGILKCILHNERVFVNMSAPSHTVVVALEVMFEAAFYWITNKQRKHYSKQCKIWNEY